MTRRTKSRAAPPETAVLPVPRMRVARNDVETAPAPAPAHKQTSPPQPRKRRPKFVF
jgi:hypothetical protein